VSAAQFEGIPVSFCLPGSPAERAGVRQGDKLLFVNGLRMASVDDYIEARAKNPRGMTLTLQRGSDIHDMTLAFDFDERVLLPATGVA
jgi:S1-C subfamily serine protease